MKRFGIAASAAALILGSVLVSAQEMAVVELEDVTANSPAYWGQTVSLEGGIAEYLNSYIFVLNEGVAIDDDRVLVVNDTGRPFPSNFVRGTRVMITGTVLPSLDARINDSNASPFVDNVFNDMNRYSSMAMNMPGMMPTEDVQMMRTTDPMMMPTVDPMMATSDPAMMPTTDPMLLSTTDPMMATSDPAMMPTTDPMMMPTSDPAMMPTTDPMMMATSDPMTPGGMSFNPLDYGWEDPLAFYYGAILPEEFNVYTIIRLSDFNGAMLVPQG